jgi:hypothetical protein
LNSAEQAVVVRLLQLARLETSSYASQVAELRVVSRCRCGCASIDFMHLRPAASILVDAYGFTSGHDTVGVLLWENQGHLSSLEIYSMWTDSAALPVADSLTLDHPDPPRN